jgi:alpha-D-ribose 1-methylphosphonate 5-triphosphate diphosphatase PhnM
VGVPRVGDALVQESVQEHVSPYGRARRPDRQGGNCLIGDDFSLPGKDYFADSVALPLGPREGIHWPPTAGVGGHQLSAIEAGVLGHPESVHLGDAAEWSASYGVVAHHDAGSNDDEGCNSSRRGGGNDAGVSRVRV